MSSFLGPIHYWLYNKIQMQQAVVNELYPLGKNYGLNLEQDCEERFGVFFDKPLEKMIDYDNIHGWLQDKVARVEYKFAYCVTTLLKQDADLLGQLKDILRGKGRQLGQSITETDIDAPFIYKVITDNLLDGMPCDHANSLIDQKEEELVWKRNICVHSSYWEEVGGDIQIYYQLRDAWMEGLVKECGFTLNKIDSATYRITKEVLSPL